MKKKRAAKLEPKPPPKLPSDAHKGVAGRVLLFCGSRLYPGAAILCARAAQRGGAGLVTLAALDDALLALVPQAAPEAIYIDLCGPADPEPRALRELLQQHAPHAIVAGCGLSQGERAKRLVDGLLACELDVPLLLDADALNLVAPQPERLRAWRGPVVITPHPGEAARLLGRLVPADAKGRTATARELARKSGAIVCLKGHRTVVSDGEREYENRSGNSGMATAGAGDVLAGILAAYLAACVALPDEGWQPLDAAVAAVHVHGLAGDLAAATLGRRGLIASDLIERLPHAQKSLGR